MPHQAVHYCVSLHDQQAISPLQNVLLIALKIVQMRAAKKKNPERARRKKVL